MIAGGRTIKRIVMPNDGTRFSAHVESRRLGGAGCATKLERPIHHAKSQRTRLTRTDRTNQAFQSSAFLTTARRLTSLSAPPAPQRHSLAGARWDSSTRTTCNRTRPIRACHHHAKVWPDDRGFFYNRSTRRAFASTGSTCVAPRQSRQSVGGTLRGRHFSAAKGQAKLVRCLAAGSGTWRSTSARLADAGPVVGSRTDPRKLQNVFYSGRVRARLCCPE